MRRPAAILPLLLLAAAPGARARLVISEVHYHPVEPPAFLADGTPALDLTDDVHEFVEIQNTGAEAVDLGGWRLAGGVRLTFPSGTTVPPGGCRVAAANPSRLTAVYGASAGTVLGPWAGRLANEGDAVRLVDPAGVTVDTAVYSGGFPWPGSANAFGAQDRFTGLDSAAFAYRGRSLQRVSGEWSGGDPANWLASPLPAGPSPGAPQALSADEPRPVALAFTRAQASDGAAVVRPDAPVRVTCAFSSTNALSLVRVEYFADDPDITNEARVSVPMSALGGGRFTAELPGHAERTAVRFRFRANRGTGLETVSPRADDPALAPVGAGGAREAWHGYFVTPERSGGEPAYDVQLSAANAAALALNISQSPRRVTVASATGVPREIPYVSATAPQWNGTVPAVFAHGGELFDIHLRHHGSRYHRATGNRSYKLHFPENHPFQRQTAWFVTGHDDATAEGQAILRLAGLPASRTRTVHWFLNGDAGVTRLEQGEFAGEMLDEFHAEQRARNPALPPEETGELYKVVGNISASQNNAEGPFTKGDQAPMLANAGWTQLRRYEWNYSLQNHAWKGHRPIRDLVEGMWAARGDTPAAPGLDYTSTRDWFAANFDLDATLTSLALSSWMCFWDDTGHNQFFWRRANGRWVRLPWDYDETIDPAYAAQSIYANENGGSVFLGPNWWKDSFFKAQRAEFRLRLWELNNTLLDPVNLAARGCPRAAAFAAARQPEVNAQTGLGAYRKPARPAAVFPLAGDAAAEGDFLETSAYGHPTGRPHASTLWEILPAEDPGGVPVFRTSSTTDRTRLAIPTGVLGFGRGYVWRATHVDADGHPSVPSPDTAFTAGALPPAAAGVVLNEILADNRGAAPHAGAFPDYVELRNNSSVPVNLAGHTLTDDPARPGRFSFPPGTGIPPGGHLVVWCDERTGAPGLHSGFGLSAEGETLWLFNGGGVVDRVAFGPQAADLAVGRVTDGTGAWVAATPTPGAANAAAILGDASALRLNEWMAAPDTGDDWIELHNTDPVRPVPLQGLFLSDDPGQPRRAALPALSFAAPGGFCVLRAVGAAGGAGSLEIKLSADGEILALTDGARGDLIDAVAIPAQDAGVSAGRWPDGSDARATFPGSASPGRPNWKPAPVVIHEVLAAANPPGTPFIELHNPTARAVDLGGWGLSDDALRPFKFRLPPGTVLAPGQLLAVTAAALAGAETPFSPSPAGGELWLTAADGQGRATGWRAPACHGAAEPGIAFGRFPVGNGAVHVRLAAPTPGAPNAAPETGPAVIHEIHYHPDGTGDEGASEFVELHNPGAVDIALNGWELAGGTDFTFPPAAVVPAGGYLLVTGLHPVTNSAAVAAFRAAFAVPAEVAVLGPWSNRLGNAGQTVALTRPGPEVSLQPTRATVDRAAYRDEAPWPAAADGDGASLQRVIAALPGDEPAAWTAAAPTAGRANAAGSTAPVILTGPVLAGAVAGTAWAQPLRAAAAVPPLTWELAAGTLPEGIALDPSGQLDGTPVSPGAHAFVLRARDALGREASRALHWTVAAQPLGLATAAALPDAGLAQPYSAALAAQGGTPPVVWSVESGALAPGLRLAAHGVLSGSPSAAGDFSFTLRAEDAGGLSQAGTFTLRVLATPLAMQTGTPLPEGERSQAYAVALAATGGLPPYRWSLAGGGLPAGLALDGEGALSGTPAASGEFALRLRVEDQESAAVERDVTLRVRPPPLGIVTASPLPEAVRGFAYALDLAAAGGEAPHAWTVDAGALPQGLTLTPQGRLSGTPGEAGTFALRLRLADATGAAVTRDDFLTVQAEGPLHRLVWEHAPGGQSGVPFAVKLTARDALDRVVSSFSGEARVTGVSLDNPAGAVRFSEVTDENEDQFELQNTSDQTVDTTGWFVRVGDRTSSASLVHPVTFTLPPSLAPRQVLRVSELNIPGRAWFGSTIAWVHTNPRGWVMLFDAQGRPRDFFAFGWPAAQLAGFSAAIGTNTVTLAGLWTGAGAAAGARVDVNATTGSWQRGGGADRDGAEDWTWHPSGQNLGAVNPALALPWAALAVPVAPDRLRFEAGVAVGFLAVDAVSAETRLTASDGGAIRADSPVFRLDSPPADGDGDGLPDAWELAHGLDAGTADADADPDGDGADNRAEFHARTRPDLAAEALRVGALSARPDGGLRLAWSAASGVVYRVSVSDDLLHWRVVPETTVLAPGPGDLPVAVPAEEGGPRGLRVEVLTAP